MHPPNVRIPQGGILAPMKAGVVSLASLVVALLLVLLFALWFVYFTDMAISIIKSDGYIVFGILLLIGAVTWVIRQRVLRSIARWLPPRSDPAGHVRRIAAIARLSLCSTACLDFALPDAQEFAGRIE